MCGAARHVAGTHAAARTLKAGKRPYTLVATLHANTVDLSIKKLKCTVPQHPDVRRFRTFWFCQTATVLPSPSSHTARLSPLLRALCSRCGLRYSTSTSSVEERAPHSRASFGATCIPCAIWPVQFRVLVLSVRVCLSFRFSAGSQVKAVLHNPVVKALPRRCLGSQN